MLLLGLCGNPHVPQEICGFSHIAAKDCVSRGKTAAAWFWLELSITCTSVEKIHNSCMFVLYLPSYLLLFYLSITINLRTCYRCPAISGRLPGKRVLIVPTSTCSHATCCHLCFCSSSIVHIASHCICTIDVMELTVTSHLFPSIFVFWPSCSATQLQDFTETYLKRSLMVKREGELL